MTRPRLLDLILALLVGAAILAAIGQPAANMRPRWYEAPTCTTTAGGVSIDPGTWIGDDGVRASAWIVSIRQARFAGDRAGLLVFGAAEVPPSRSPRPWSTPGISTARPIGVALVPGSYRAEVWGGSATTDGNYPTDPPIYEWGVEASDQTVRPAECFFTVAAPPPPPPPPPADEGRLVGAARAATRALVLHLRAGGFTWAQVHAHPWGHAYYVDLGGR